MPLLRVSTRDGDTGLLVETRASILASSGGYVVPKDALLGYVTDGTNAPPKPKGRPYFYCAGSFEVDAPAGRTWIRVERGIEWDPVEVSLTLAAGGAATDIDIVLRRWVNSSNDGWYAGNTHVHYSLEARPEERVSLDPRVEDLPVFIVSHLENRGTPYASNAFPIGRRENGAYVVDVGEETRHNVATYDIGYGHVMLVGLREPVVPLSRGMLVDDASPDYPPLIDACRDARHQGGVTIWCHNGRGMEAPVAAINGALDALNVFDPWFRIDPDFEIWYRMLNCGIRLPLSTGTDWFVSSTNRVYVQVEDDFDYVSWLGSLAAGRTYATNGPLLSLNVDGHRPNTQRLGPTRRRTVRAEVTWNSAFPVDRVEIVGDGEVVMSWQLARGESEGTLAANFGPRDYGWIAARCYGAGPTRFDQPLWAHTSPVYLDKVPTARRRAGARYFTARLRESERWIRAKGRFDQEAHRTRTLELYGEARERFEALQSG
jgi:TolB protein